MQNAAPRETTIIPTLAGWRAVSVIAVVLFHGRYRFFGDASLLTAFSARGHLGVDVFFVISGFLICRQLLMEQARTGAIDLRQFYLRRGFRILPPYYVTLAVLLALGCVGAIHIRFLNLPSCLFLYRNSMPLGVDDRGDFYTAHFWSLAVEEQFYLLWPLLLLGLKAVRSARVAFCLALLSLIWKMLLGYFPILAGAMPVALSLMAHTDTLLWGCMAAIFLPQIQQCAARINFSQLWLPILVVLVVTQESHNPALRTLSAILLPALVLSTVLQPTSWLGRLLEQQPLRWIGTLSYSIYLWQQLFLPEFAPEAARGTLSLLQQTPWNVAAIMLCACCSRYLVEVPAMRLGRRLSASRPALDTSMAGLRRGVNRAAGTLATATDLFRRTGS